MRRAQSSHNPLCFFPLMKQIRHSQLRGQCSPFAPNGRTRIPAQLAWLLLSEECVTTS